jgi:hypothetical protein
MAAEGGLSRPFCLQTLAALFGKVYARGRVAVGAAFVMIAVKKALAVAHEF